jgi:RimJ/RimL family protein N-acetyltransferase
MPDARLRSAVPDDAEALARLARDPGVEPFVSTLTERDPDAMRRLLAEPEPGTGHFAVHLDGRVAGGCGFRVRNERSRIAEVRGVMVDPAVRGRGVGEAAVRALAGVLFDDHGFHRLEVEVYGYNAAAVRLFERCGFVLEGVRRRAYWRNEAWQDSVLLALLVDER